MRDLAQMLLPLLRLPETRNPLLMLQLKRWRLQPTTIKVTLPSLRQLSLSLSERTSSELQTCLLQTLFLLEPFETLSRTLLHCLRPCFHPRRTNLSI